MRVNLGTTASDSNLKGLVSNINVSAIIEKQMEYRNRSIQGLQDTIDVNYDKLKALEELNLLAGNIFNNCAKLRFSPGLEGAASNTFDKRLAFLSLNSSVSANLYANIAVASGTKSGSFDFEIIQLAQSKVEGSLSFSSKSSSVVQDVGVHDDPSLFTAGTFKINGIDITLEADDTLVDIEAKINYFTSQTNVEAYIAEPSLNQFLIILESTKEGIDNSYIITDNDNILNNTFAYDAIVNPTPLYRPPLNAIVKYEGMQSIERSSNIINDFIPGISISLYQETPNGTKLKADIVPDIAYIKQEITKFAENYNNLIKFIAKHQQSDIEKKLPLHNDIMVSNILFAVKNIINFANPDNVKYKSLMDIGFSLLNTEPNILTKEPAYFNLLNINDSVLTTALETDIDSVRKLFEFSFQSSSSKLLLGKDRKQADIANISDIKFIFNFADEVPAKVEYKINNVVKSVDLGFQYFDPLNKLKGGSVTGPANTPFNGLTFLYIGAGFETINLKMTQGVGDALYNIVTQYKTPNGLIQDTKKQLSVENSKYQDEKQNKQQLALNEKQDIINKFARVEQKVAEANANLEFLELLNNTNSKG